jgi:hypothetical protein
MSPELRGLLEEAKKLPAEQRRELADLIVEDIRHEASDEPRRQANLALVDELYGSLKGLDPATVRWLAEDEELCGY